MAKIKAISDEEIIAALMQNRTIMEAAMALGISPRAIYERADSRGFRAAYSRARDEVLRSAVFGLNSRLDEAVRTVADIMADENVNASIRLQAAQTVINTAVKLADHLKGAENVSRLEGKSLYDYTDEI